MTGKGSQNILLIIQARMGSSRLPGKVLKPILNTPILKHVIDRVSKVSLIDKIVVATSTQAVDFEIVKSCANWGIPTYCGSELDVLDRFYQTAVNFCGDIIIRITSDCPLIDPGLIEIMLEHFLSLKNIDYFTNTLPPRTFPRGLDAEIFTFKALQQAWHNDNNPQLREHVTPYLYTNPNIFNCKGYFSEIDYSHHRWTVDTAEDFLLIQTIYDALGPNFFNWKDILQILNKHPEWSLINSHIKQKNVL